LRQFHRLKEVLVSIGFKNRNHILTILDAGVSIDTTKRIATQRLKIQWRKPVTPALQADLESIAPMLPSSESYACDVDKIFFIFEEQKSKKA